MSNRRKNAATRIDQMDRNANKILATTKSPDVWAKASRQLNRADKRRAALENRQMGALIASMTDPTSSTPPPTREMAEVMLQKEKNKNG